MGDLATCLESLECASDTDLSRQVEFKTATFTAVDQSVLQAEVCAL